MKTVAYQKVDLAATWLSFQEIMSQAMFDAAMKLWNEDQAARAYFDGDLNHHLRAYAFAEKGFNQGLEAGRLAGQRSAARTVTINSVPGAPAPIIHVHNHPRPPMDTVVVERDKHGSIRRTRESPTP